MNRNYIENAVKDIICKLMDSQILLHQINDNTNIPRDLGLNSIQIVQLMIELEMTLDIRFEDNDLDEQVLINLGRLLEAVWSKVSHQKL